MQGHQMLVVWLGLIGGNGLLQAIFVGAEPIDQHAQEAAFLRIIHKGIAIENDCRQSHAGGFAAARQQSLAHVGDRRQITPPADPLRLPDQFTAAL